MTEGGPVEDRGLGGDDPKAVSYSILSTKRDHEAILQPPQEIAIDGPTDGARFAGLKVAEFLARLRTEGVEKPPGWEARQYPTAGAGRVKDIRESAVGHDGAAHIGFEFGCVWDDEHGAGVRTHRGRAIATGQA